AVALGAVELRGVLGVVGAVGGEVDGHRGFGVPAGLEGDAVQISLLAGGISVILGPGGDLVAVSVHQVAPAAGDGAEGHIVQGALGILVIPEVLEVVDVELHILAGLGGVDDVAGGGGAFLDLEGDGAGVVVLALFIHIGPESKRNIALVILVGSEGHIFQIVIVVILILGRSIQLAALGRDAVKLYIYKFIMAAEFFNG